MQDYTIISSQIYREAKYGISMFTDSRICIIGEQLVKLENGLEIEQYVYNIVGHASKNGNIYVSLKGNIVLE